MRPTGTAAELERRRRLAIEKLQDGYTTREVADFLNIDIRSVQIWWQRFRKRGERGLTAQPPPGRPPKLNRTQTLQVLGWFRKSPKSFGFTTDLWTAKRVNEIIRRKWGIEFNWRYLLTWLRRRNITPQKPQRVAREADPEAIERWRTTEWPRLQNGRDANGPPLFSTTKAACS